MSKFDKKVLKYIAKRHEEDLDVDDLAIGLRLDNDAVLEALDSLKNQGRIESFPRNGKTYWRLSMPQSAPVEEAIPPRVQNEPGLAAIDLDQAPSAPVISPPKRSFPGIDNEDNDMDLDQSPRLFDSPVARIAVAVVLSVAISAVVSMIVSGGSQKGFSDGFQALERKSTEKNAELDRRITEISAQVGILNDKLSSRPQPKADQSQTAKPSHPPRKKKATPKPSPIDENGASEPSGGDQSSPSPNSGQTDNPAPESPSSTEGTGQ
jgi:hypothetical protein